MGAFLIYPVWLEPMFMRDHTERNGGVSQYANASGTASAHHNSVHHYSPFELGRELLFIQQDPGVIELAVEL